MSMADRKQFAEEEWRTVLGGAFMAGFAVTAAQPSGLVGMIKEGIASRRALAEAGKRADANPLVRSVADALRAKAGRKLTNEFAAECLRGVAQEDLKTRAIAAIRQAALVVERRAPDDAKAFKEWLLHIASCVARASKEGSFFGFGGAKVGEQESATLSEIASAIGLERPQ
jgi:hypothetical protein